MLVIIFFVSCVAARSCRDAGLRALPFCNASLSFAERVADLLPRLSVAEQLSQLSMHAPAIPELGMQEYNYGGEALHGLWANCVNISGVIKCPTQFGSPLLMGCSFNRRLWRAVADATSTEIRALYAAAGGQAHSLEGPPLGLTYYAPNINLARDPRWGRNEEVPSEDPLVAGEYGFAFTKGFQEGDVPSAGAGFEEGDAPSGPAESAVAGRRYWKASVVAKHFAAYSLETSTIPSYANRNGSEGAGFVNRHAFDARVSEQDLQETYLPAFARVVEAGAGGVMCSYNAINGVPSCVNQEDRKSVV